jgi:hypothetical protein
MKKTWTLALVSILLAACGVKNTSAVTPVSQPDPPLVIEGKYGVSFTKELGGYAECPPGTQVSTERMLKFDDHVVHVTRTDDGIKFDVDGSATTQVDMMDVYRFQGVKAMEHTTKYTTVYVCYVWPDKIGFLQFKEDRPHP